MENAIVSTRLVRPPLPLKARIGLFKSAFFVPSQFQSNFFQSLWVNSFQRVNRQIKWGIKNCHLHKKFDCARDLFLKDKFFP